MLEEHLKTAQTGIDLTVDQMQQAILWMLSGQVSDQQISDLLVALAAKGESVSELVGAARALRLMMSPIRTEREGLLDTCGTGGDGAKTFNISTAVALVAAAAGANVAKHGNKKVTSATGSADVLSELGVKIDATRDVVEACMNQLGICFCFAPLLHPAMKHVGAVRRSLSIPTLFNYLGPLCNPAGATYQIIGVGKKDLQAKIAATLLQLPIEAAIVVRGEDGLDEVTLSADTSVLHIQQKMLTQTTWTTESFGLSKINAEDLVVECPVQSAQVILNILKGESGPPRDIVLANAAAALWVAGITHSLMDGVSRAEKAIDSGAAMQILQELRTKSNASVKAG
jgi:anthranilate phosphoribosyltransferase